MHIPSAPTAEIDVLSFGEALAQSGRNAAYDPEKWIYVPDHYEEYRYILGTRGKKPLICIGINPSTAEPDNLDNTLKSVQRIAAFNGFDSFIMFNVYAQRATRPQDMESEENRFLHRENMAAFRYILQSCEGTPAVWAAWGSILDTRGYLKSCVAEMIEIGDSYGARWYTAGKRTKLGHPHHPLYLKKDSALEDFDIRDYCKECL